MKILLIGDNPGDARSIDEMLKESRVSFVLTYNERIDDALNSLKESSADIILIDLKLPDGSGLDRFNHLYKNVHSIPIIVLTEVTDEELGIKTVRAGAQDYLVKKHFDSNLLVRSIRYAIERKHTEIALRDSEKRYQQMHANLETIFRSIKDAIVTVDRDLNVIDYNDAAKKICGFAQDSAGKSISSFQTCCSAKCLSAVEKTINDKETVSLDSLDCRYEDIHNRVIKFNSTPLTDNEGNFMGAVLVIRDDTRLANLERNLRERQQFHNIVGQNSVMQGIYSLIEDLADVQTNVLITGESGTGKELVAEALHLGGIRSEKPLVKVNCSALSENLLESELFGHVKGAFTGADRDKIGRFQRAEGGTIFLDEIGDISPRIQLRLLRVLQEKEFERVGDSTPIKADVRIIAATNQDIRKKIRLGEFREDLYYRLKVVELEIPPLRERRDDIPLLVDHFIKKFKAKYNRNTINMSEEVKKIFMNYRWPGNVRELEHTMEHVFVLSRDSVITIDDLPAEIRTVGTNHTTPHRNATNTDYETIRDALEKSRWNKAKAARLLGINVRTIYRKLEKYKDLFDSL